MRKVFLQSDLINVCLSSTFYFIFSYSKYITTSITTPELASLFFYLGDNKKNFRLDYGKKKSNIIILLHFFLSYKIPYLLKVQIFQCQSLAKKYIFILYNYND